MNQLKHPFFISVVGGFFVWFFLFFIIPAKVTYPLSLETISFVGFSYFFLILGYLVIPFYKTKKLKEPTKIIIYYSIVFVLLCFIIRFIDIFYFRELRFSNTIHQNRTLAGKEQKNLIFITASIFKSLYFVPLLLLLLSKIKNKSLLVLSSLFFILPLLEAVLRGSRSTFLISFLFFILVLLITESITFTKKNIFIFSISLVLLFVISTQILMSREGSKNKNAYGYLIEKAIYNDFLKPKQSVINYMNNPIVSDSKKKLVLSAMQIGQYYTHGLFEFDYIVKYYKKNKFNKQFGKYTFWVIPKFTNKYKLTKIDSKKIYKASPRGYTFISFFGGMYLDFGWFTLLIMFLFGVFQKWIYLKVQHQQFAYAPLYIFFLFANFFMLTFNFYRGTGTYTLLSCILFILVFYFFRKKEIMSN